MTRSPARIIQIDTRDAEPDAVAAASSLAWRIEVVWATPPRNGPSMPTGTYRISVP